VAKLVEGELKELKIKEILIKLGFWKLIFLIYFLLIIISSIFVLAYYKGWAGCGWLAVFIKCSPLEAIIENIYAWGITYLLIFLIPMFLIRIVYKIVKMKIKH